jgi:hypothetical protein
MQINHGVTQGLIKGQTNLKNQEVGSYLLNQDFTQFEGKNSIENPNY